MRLYVSAPSATLNFNGLLWHVVNSRLSNSENLSRVSHKMTELALLHWKDWIFTSFEDESPNMRVHCNSLQQVTVPMHCENCCNFIDNALITLQPRDCDVYKIYTRLSRPIGDWANWQERLWICRYTILHCLLLHGEPHAYGKVPCCSSHLQIYSTHCYTGSNVVQLSIHKKRIVALTQSMQYLISITV